MERVSASDVWIPVHFMLIWSSVLALVAMVGIARSYREEDAAAWGRIAVMSGVVATTIAVVTFLIDGAVVKHIADLWAANPRDPAVGGVARLATEIGFILVAGLQLGTGMVALAFGLAGLR